LYRYVDGNVAIAPTPSIEELGPLSSRFKLVVILVDEEEAGYPRSLWKRYGVETVYEPIPALQGIEIPRLHRIVKKIANFVAKGRGDVLIHCFAGRGRSGMVAAAYLAYRYGLDGRKAIEFVRQRVPGAIETRDQEAVVETYAYLLRMLGYEALDAVVALGNRFEWGSRDDGARHATAVTIFATRFLNALSTELGIDRDGAVAMLIASLLHDVGRALGEPHHEYSYRAILGSEELRVLPRNIVELAALIALHHRESTDPRNDSRTASYRNIVLPLIGIVRTANALDALHRWSVADVALELRSSRIVVKAFCRDSVDGCSYEVSNAYRRSVLLRETLARDIYIVCS